MNTDLPLVSIIIPCFNAERWVAEAISSAVGQSYPEIEVVVVDDGSTDRSLDIIKSTGDRIHVIAGGSNRGACAARNAGLAICSGKYVKFLDADDQLALDIVEKQVHAAESHGGERLVVFSAHQLMRSDGTSIGRPQLVEPFNAGDPILWSLRNNAQTSCTLHRRDLLDEVGGFDEALPRGQEYDLHLRMAAAGVRFEYVAGTAVYVRQHLSLDKIGNIDFLAQDPLCEYRWLQDRVQKLRACCAASFSVASMEHIAQDYWSCGRRLLRSGHPEEAKLYFAAARTLAPHGHLKGSNLYSRIARTAGPVTAEFAGGQKRRALAYLGRLLNRIR